MMNKKLLWTLLALAVVVIVILAIALPGSGSREKTQDAETAPEAASEVAPSAAEEQPEPEQRDSSLEEGELPLDTTQPKQETAAAGGQISAPAEQEESEPRVDPDTGIELDEDELPLDEP